MHIFLNFKLMFISDTVMRIHVIITIVKISSLMVAAQSKHIRQYVIFHQLNIFQ